MKVYAGFFKRIIDFIAASLLFVCLFPVFAAVALAVRIKMGSPVMFTQRRPGKNEKIFRVMKFRTMTSEKDSNGNLLPDSVRLTKLGAFLRKTSLDEIPQIINVIKGDMSFIGPRPLLVEYLPYYTEEEKLRHSVRPGITGLAQINGRNNTTWEKKFSYDINYVKNISFLLDAKIAFLTIVKVLKRSDIQTANTEQPLNIVRERKWH